MGTAYSITASTGRLAMAAVMAKSDIAPEIRLLTLVSMAQSRPSLMMRWLTPNMITMA